MNRKQIGSRLGKSLGRAATAALVVALAFGVLMGPGSSTATAQAPSDRELAAEKEYWQNRYRSLLRDERRLKQEIEIARGNYAAANRRNYRRGTARHVAKKSQVEAEAELAKVQVELDGIQEEARRSGALPGWFYEVEREPVSAPALPASSDGSDEEDDSDGRNPLYLKKK